MGVDRLVPERTSRRLVAVAVLALAITGAAIFALPFAFPTAPPIITRFKATVTFSPNGDGLRDTAQVLLRVRQPSDVLLEVRDDDGVVQTLIDERKPRGLAPVTWDGTDEQGNTVPDGTYALRLRAEAGRRKFNVSRTITVDTTAPRFARFEVRSAAFQRRQRGRCRVQIEADDDARLVVEVQRTSSALLRRIGPRPVKESQLFTWHWSATQGGEPLDPGLYRIQARIRDGAGNGATRSASCWVSNVSGVPVPARPSRGDKVGALVRNAEGEALPPNTPVQLALYERNATPGQDPGRPLGTRVGGRASGPMATTRVTLPRRRPPGELWLVATTPQGQALIPLAAPR